ncbi:hypothetical protein B6D29_03265 [Microgenomates bacterium UTCPR1]|nr:MAG: hypothetical protein B6D29_03265 [Microgenomates bacterium UTCPR1]
MNKRKGLVSNVLNQYAIPLLGISLAINLLLIVSGIVKTKSNSLSSTNKTTVKVDPSKDNLFNEINPEKGFEINAKFGDLGPKMLSLGVIDYDKFKSTYEKSGQKIPAELDGILKNTVNKKVKITRDNSYFLLNFFWAVGLANKSKILDEGEIVKYGGLKEAGNFASTGGWSLAKSNPMEYYSKASLIPLTKEQEDLVAKVSSNVYRPCCDNSTAFPDCNHGMALLAVFQLMASNNATENQMYEAGKYFNAFWFPGNYYDLALYFKNKEGKSFKNIPAQVLLGKDYSSATASQTVKQWLAEKGLIQEPPKQGGGCGV